MPTDREAVLASLRYLEALAAAIEQALRAVPPDVTVVVPYTPPDKQQYKLDKAMGLPGGGCVKGAVPSPEASEVTIAQIAIQVGALGQGLNGVLKVVEKWDER